MARRAFRPSVPDEVREIRRRFNQAIAAGLSTADASRLASEGGEIPKPVQIEQEPEPEQTTTIDAGENLNPAPPVPVNKAYAALDLLGDNWEEMKWSELVKIAQTVSMRPVKSRTEAVNAIRLALLERKSNL